LLERLERVGDLGQALELCEQRAGVLEQHVRRAREPDGAARGLDERDADLALERGELLGDGGRGEVQGVGRRGDRAAVGDLPEGADTAQVDHVAILAGAREKVHSLCPVLARIIAPCPAPTSSWPSPSRWCGA
jgi:hypothetical protein